MRKLVMVVFALTVGLFALAVNAPAQNSPSCTALVSCGWNSLWPIPGNSNNCSAGAYNCQVTGPWLIACDVQNASCPPAAAPFEDCPTCNAARAAQGAPATASNPVNLATGNTYIQQSDLRIPGLGRGLTLVRTWNSKWPSNQSAPGLFGPNWRSTYEESVFLGSDHYMKYARSDGSFISFGYNGPVWAIAGSTAGGGSGSNFMTMITPTMAAPNTTITFQNGEQRIFNGTSGALLSIIDRNGNTTTLTYDSANRLYQVTDPASRTLTFTYQNPSSHLVTGVSSSVGVSTSYAYDAQNRLSVVTNQDSTTLTFAYDSQSRITSVTDSNGKVLESHTYDSSSRGLTSSRALGVEAITLSY